MQRAAAFSSGCFFISRAEAVARRVGPARRRDGPENGNNGLAAASKGKQGKGRRRAGRRLCAICGLAAKGKMGYNTK